MPWNNEIKFGGPPPVSMAAEWHNRNYSQMIETTDPVQMVSFSADTRVYLRCIG